MLCLRQARLRGPWIGTRRLRPVPRLRGRPRLSPTPEPRLCRGHQLPRVHRGSERGPEKSLHRAHPPATPGRPPGGRLLRSGQRLRARACRAPRSSNCSVQVVRRTTFLPPSPPLATPIRRRSAGQSAPHRQSGCPGWPQSHHDSGCCRSPPRGRGTRPGSWPPPACPSAGRCY